MAYRKPGVEITFQQRTLSPNVPTPTLLPFVFGEGYYVTEITDNKDSQFLTTLTTTGLLTAATGISGYAAGGYVWWSGGQGASDFTNDSVQITLPTSVASGTYDSTSFYVDLVGTRYTASGTVPGITRHLWKDSDASINEFTYSNGVITISGVGRDSTDPIGTNWSNSEVKVGFRMLRRDLGSYLEMDGQDAIKTQIGKICAENPLALGTYNAQINAGTTIYAFGVSGYADANYTTALDFASTKDVYALAPLTQKASVHTLVVAHVDAMSTATAKRERMALLSRPALESPDLSDSTVKGTVATEYAAQAYELSNRRVSYIVPPVAYVEELKHISQLHPDYVTNMLKTQNTAFPITGIKAKLLSTTTLSDSTKYYAGAEITETVWSGLVTDTASVGGVNIYHWVRYPVTGSIIAAAIAGQVAGLSIAQGFTNLNLAGNISEVKYSSDWFSEAQLDTIAGGGNYIIHQRNLNSALRCRHSLMTDMSSVERRELSITKTLDYVAKTLRSALDPYIGRYNITTDFLQKLSTVISAVRVILQRTGVVADLKLESLRQDTVNRDIVLVSVLAKPFYPANYIRVTLAF